MSPISIINDVVFTSALTDVSFSISAPCAFVSLSADGIEVFNTSMLSYGGRVCISDLREIIEETLRENDAPSAEFSLMVSDPENHEQAASISFRAVFSLASAHENATNWLAQNFLTTLKARRTFRSVKESLSLLELSALSVTPVYRVALAFGNICRSVDIPAATIPVPPSKLISLEVGFNTIAAAVEAADLSNVDIPDDIDPQVYEILSWAVIVGDRVASFFLEDSTPETSMLSLNNFNAPEYANFHAASHHRSSFEKAEAVADGSLNFYDYQVNQKCEVESGPLSLREALWLRELTLSRSVALICSPSRNCAILIDEADLNITPDSSEPSYVNFSWRYADRRLHLENDEPPQEVFNQTFDNTFN